MASGPYLDSRSPWSSVSSMSRLGRSSPSTVLLRRPHLPASRHVGLAGGAMRVLSEAPRPRGGTWNSDGLIVFAPDLTGPLYRISAAGGDSTPITGISGAATRPLFLPDGKHFLFSLRSRPGASAGNGIFAGSLDSGVPKQSPLRLLATWPSRPISYFLFAAALWPPNRSAPHASAHWPCWFPVQHRSRRTLPD
jgi:hypothetical protein